MFSPLLTCAVALSATAYVHAVTFQPLTDKPGLVDNGTHGEIEIVHLFHNEPPIGITVSKSGRAFVTFNRCAHIFRPSTLERLIPSAEDPSQKTPSRSAKS